MAEKIAIDLLIKTGQSAQNLGDLEKSLEDMNKRLREVDKGSEDFKKLQNAIAQTGREVKNLELQMESLDNEQIASELGSVAGAIGDVTASFILLGGESETMEEIGKNIETAMGVSMGLKGAIEGIASAQKLWTNIIKTNTVVQKISTIATKFFSKALNGIPLMLIITGITLLILNLQKVGDFFVWVGKTIYDWFKPMIDLAIDGLQMLGLVASDEELEARARAEEEKKRIEKQTKTIKRETENQLKQLRKKQEFERKAHEETLKGFDREIALRKSKGQDTYAMEVKRLKEVVRFAKSEVAIEQEKVNQLQEAIKKQLALRGITMEQAKQFAENNEAMLKQFGIGKNMIDALYGTSDELEKSKDALDDALLDLEVKQNEHYTKINEERKKAHEDWLKDVEKLNEKELAEKKKLEEDKLKEEAKAREIRRKAEEDARKLLAEDNKTDREKEIKAVFDKYSALIQANWGNHSLVMELTESQRKQLNEINEKWDKKEQEEKKAKLTETINNTLQSTANSLNVLSEMSNQRLENELKNAEGNEARMIQIRKKAFEREKKLNIAKAIIGGAQAVMQALAGSPPPFNFINAGIVGASTLAQLNAIKNTKFDGGGGAGSSSVGGAGASAGNSGNGVNLRPVSNTSTILGDQQVVVAEGDITSVQNKVMVAENQATF